ncbi:MAG: micrococcal nuclease [Candidatus Parcubacteria bacterium]|jgi:micrococcal nuclease|nr:micrococcal nuclease [Candidatus Parcubacteria bacterium]
MSAALKKLTACCIGILFVGGGLLFLTDRSGGEVAKQTQSVEEGFQAPSSLYSVVDVVDGDTVKIRIDNEVQTFRLIGIDTPETVHPTQAVECFGREASNRAKALLTDAKVYVETDPSQGTYDKYNRRLGYIFLENGSNLNLKMIQEGFAQEYTYNLPYKYQAQFKEAETTARVNKEGLWADNACASETPESKPTAATMMDLLATIFLEINK